MSANEPRPASSETALAESAFDIAALSDPGTRRSNNEDSCGHLIDGPDTAVVVVADGVGGYEGGEVASAMAVEVTLEAWRDSPVAWGAAKRLTRAVQRANIEIHNRALAVPELRGMCTTVTAIAVDRGMLSAAHVGDCRLYLMREGKVLQLTKDHTVVGERVRMGLLSEEEGRIHPERSSLQRSLGRDLIASVDRITMPLIRDDRLVLCSDGLHNVLRDNEIDHITRHTDSVSGCRQLIDTANERGTRDNLTVAMFRMVADTGLTPTPTGWRSRLGRLFGRSA
ncbi:MAG TPA: protein phosphatase 2C domain-containing protein [Candidatus Binataceae bacterium]|nr:protein phosphatase 2C domain-containing protein [Candidatus Binataceae bacterium]